MKEIYLMKKTNFWNSLPFKLMVGVLAGVVIGLVLSSTDGNAFSKAILNIVVTLKYILNQIINFCIPLIIIAFIAPSITQMGKNASKLLLIAVTIAYSSSVGAALFSTAAGYALIPHLSISSTADGLKELPAAVFELSIPQIMPVMSALVFSIMIGLAIVSRIMIPILPFFIGLTFCGLSYEGSITKQVPVFLKIIIIVLIGHYIWMTLLYTIAGLYSKKNPIEVIRHYGPAYLTSIGTMSSAATLAVALQCAGTSKVLRKDLVSFGIPLFANIHLCGSVLTEVFFCMTVSKILYGTIPSAGTMLLFCVLLGIFAIGAPGVPGGTVMASLGLITGVLGFNDTGTALMLTIFALQDSFGTACNVTGDGALTLILTGYAERHGIKEGTDN